MKLNLGAGKDPEGWLPGYENIDASRVEAVRLMKAYPLSQFENESCEEVRASHVLEHFPHWQTAEVLREWIRVLQPGGWLKVAVPDFKWIAEQYIAGEFDFPLAGYVMGGQVDENDYHKAIFDADGLADAFRQLGLTNIGRWESEIADCASLPVSLNICGQKPEKPVERAGYGEVSIPPGEVIVTLSMPRLGFTDMFHCGMAAFSECRLTVKKSSGVFWGQCLENLMEWSGEDGAKWVLTCDYDSLFTGADIRELYRLATTYGADCVAALQIRRDKDSPLFCIEVPDGEREILVSRETLEQDLLPVSTAHFGLTLVRLEAVQRMAKPWFSPVPNAEGRWQEGKMDEDIHFWHKWREAGNTLYLAPHVVIGHTQMVATWPDTELHAKHQYINEYNQTGKPDWAWR